jgi:ATP-dependent protease ClpP protease subunit
MEVWYTLTGSIEEAKVSETINWLCGQLYNKRISTLKFLISSWGGDLDSAIIIHDFLRALPLKVTTIGFGQVDSAAILIFLVGDERLAVQKCRFRMHTATYDMGDPKGWLTPEGFTFLFRRSRTAKSGDLGYDNQTEGGEGKRSKGKEKY